MDFFYELFDGSGVPARWHCGDWSRPLGYLHLVSDLGVFSAFVAISLLLSYVLRKTGRKLPHPMPKLVGLFIGFIVLCGLTHLVGAVVFYRPIYGFAGALKLATAAVSWATVVALLPALPRLLALKTPSEMRLEIERATEEWRKETEARAAAQSLLIGVIDASPSGMLATDPAGRIVLVNREATRLFGYEEDELVGEVVERLIPPEQRTHHPRLRESFLEEPSARKMGGTSVLIGLRKDGSTFPIEVGLNPLTFPQGKLVLCAVVDRSEVVAHQQDLLSQQRELERSNVELESFASAASHDLKAPLRAIQNAVRWIEEDIDPAAFTGQVRENFEILKGRAARMESLLNALLDYARIGRKKSAIADIDVGSVVQNIVQLLGPQAERAVVVEGQLPSVQTTRVLLERVFSNLISNALKHCPRTDLRIVVRGCVRGTDCFFEVEDNGPGIDPRFHERIFRVFQTLRSRDEVEGAGMGLALVKKVVEREGGAVWVRSEMGQGAIFVVRWPQARLDA